ncbi:cytidylyltransferase domain-containing protein [Thermodesulfobacteriota bacterium]
MDIAIETPRIVACIEARMGASRLPGKVLADICGKPALSRLLGRLRRSELVEDIILATSINPGDDALASWAESEGVECYRGNEDDVLKRVVQANREMNSEIVVEIWGDMPLLDYELVDHGISTFLENNCEVVTTTCKPSYPIGIDVVVFRLKDLEWVEKNVLDVEVREHVSLYFFQHPERYRIVHLLAPKRLYAPERRFVLDYPEDLEFIRAVYSALEPKYGDKFGTEEILELLRKEPSLGEINQYITENKAL